MKHIWKAISKILYKALKSNSPTHDRMNIIKDRRERRRTNVWCPQEGPDLTWHFLAAIMSSSVNRFIPSVRPSDHHAFFTMFSSSHNHKIFKFKRCLLTHNTCYSNWNSRPPKTKQTDERRNSDGDTFHGRLIIKGYRFRVQLWIKCDTFESRLQLDNYASQMGLICPLCVSKISLMVNGTINKACKLEKNIPLQTRHDWDQIL